MENFYSIFITFVLLLLGFFMGRFKETQHFHSIKRRENNLKNLKAITLKKLPVCSKEVLDSNMVIGSTVVSIDYFKRFMASLKLIVGGRLTSYETLLDRARREAVLRMKESVQKADVIINVRIETSSISKGQNNNNRDTVGSIEVLAYGTAINYK